MNFYNDNDPRICAWLRELIAAGLIPPGTVDGRSITELRAEDLCGYEQCHFFAGVAGWAEALRRAGWPADRPAWSASLPCQPFSIAGQQKGTEDERHLWPTFFELVRQCGPATIFGEQVASKLTIGGIGDADDEAENEGAENLAGFNELIGTTGGESDGKIIAWIDGIFDDLEAEGYTCGAVVLPACSVGAPHRRYRIFWVANRLGARPERAGEGTQGARRPACGPSNGCDVSLPDANERGLGAGREQHVRFAESGNVSVGQPNRSGSQSRQQTSPGNGHGHSAESAGDELVQPKQPRLEGHARNGKNGNESGRQYSRSDGPIATTGAWSDYDLCHFTDGKVRRIGRRFKWMVNGLSDTVVSLRDQGVEAIQEKEINATTTKAGPSELLPPMSGEAYKKTISKRRPRSDMQLCEEKILQSSVHDAVNGGSNKSLEREKQSASISQEGSERMRAVRQERDAIIRSSQGRESDEQQINKLEDLVRLVSQAIPLAVLEGDSETCEEMLRLFPTCWKTRPVSGSLSTYAEEWRPPSLEEVERAWKADHFKNWRTWPRSPVKASQKARNWRLHGYGNSIVPQVAAEFVKAFLETENEIL